MVLIDGLFLYALNISLFDPLRCHSNKSGFCYDSIGFKAAEISE